MAETNEVISDQDKIKGLEGMVRSLVKERDSLKDMRGLVLTPKRQIVLTLISTTNAWRNEDTLDFEIENAIRAADKILEIE